MKLSLTPRPLVADLKRAVTRTWRRSLEDLEVSSASIAEAVDLNPTTAERWSKESVDHPLPVWVLAARHAVPDPLWRVVRDTIEDLRGQQGTALTGSVEAAAAALVVVVGEVLTELGRELAQGGVRRDERPRMRRAVVALRERCEVALRALDAADAAEREQ
jgi:hypothetical protein